MKTQTKPNPFTTLPLHKRGRKMVTKNKRGRPTLKKTAGNYFRFHSGEIDGFGNYTETQEI